jgi:hypothetical protein
MGGFIEKLADRLGPKVGELFSDTMKTGVRAGITQVEHSSPVSGPLAKHMIEEYESAYPRAAAPVYQEAKQAIDSVPKALHSQVFEMLDKGTTPAHPEASRAAFKIKLINDKIYNEAISKGLSDPAWQVPNFFPRKWDKVFDGVSKQQAIDHLVATKQASNPVMAEKLLNWISPGGIRNHNLELPRRLDLPGYRQDLGVLLEHIDQSYKRFAQADIFGKNDEKLSEALSGIGKESGLANQSLATKIVEHWLRRPVGHQGQVAGLASTGWERLAGSIEAAGKLSLAPLSHPVQLFGNVPAITGFKPFARALVQSAVDYGDVREFGFLSGASYHSAARMAQEQLALELKDSSMGKQVLKRTGSFMFSRMRQNIAAQSGKNMVMRNFEALRANPNDAKLLNTFNWLRVDAEAALQRGSLSVEDLRIAGQRVSNVTQLMGGSEQLPIWMRSSPEMRVLTMFKPFFYKEFRFIKDYVLKPAFLHGDMKALTMASIVFPAIGELTADLKNVVKFGDLKQRPGFDKDHWLDRIIDDYAEASMFGVFRDIAFSLSSSSPTMALREVVGPAVSDVVDFGRWGAGFLSGKTPLHTLSDQAKKELLRSIPVVGARIYHEEYPKSRRYQSDLQKGYFTKKLNKVAQTFTE